MENEALISDFRGQRTLAAVVFTDGVGFSARMSADEEHTLDLIRRDLQLMRAMCARFEGHVLKSTGDGLLMYFISAINAVACALEIQKALAEAAARLPAHDVLAHRIGIHLGDVYISDTDIMGNGVNIAARLQTEASPGGICVSQTVYDVVKTGGLSLKVVYLGPRELKNIQGAIPVYQITPLTENGAQTNVVAEPANSAPPAPIPVTRFTPSQEDSYSEVAKKLEQHADISRIRKLLFCTCQGAWENDPTRLSQFTLRQLLQELHERAPTLKHLQAILFNVVKNLSKQAEYAVLANTIIHSLETFYPRPSVPKVLFREVAQELEQDRNVGRIKKLLLCVCRDVWENDSAQLTSLDLTYLVQELTNIAPTQEHLKFALERIVKTLNKKTEYALVASTILYKARKLYQSDEAPTALVGFQPPQAVPVPVAPPMPPPNQRLQPPVIPPTPPPPVSQPQPVVTQAAPLPPLQSNLFKSPIALFDVRATIMRYTNPLIAKIVMFSALHYKLTLRDQSWSIVKAHPIDDLIRNLLQAYQSLPELESKLYSTARSLEDPQHSQQAASVILKAVQPFYSASTAVQTNPNAVAEAPSTCVSDNYSDEDATCQFLVAPPARPEITGELQPMEDQTCQLNQKPKL